MKYDSSYKLNYFKPLFSILYPQNKIIYILSIFSYHSYEGLIRQNICWKDT